jgi:hypothetical protein
MSRLVSNVGTRKMLVGAVLLISGLAVTYFKGDIPSGLLGFMQSLFAFYVAGNIGEHVSNAMVKRKEKSNE